MRKRLLILIAACFYYTGLVKLARWLHRRFGQRLIILNYHRATGGDLHRHLLYLLQHYRILHLEEALEELYSPDKERKQRNQLTPLVLTFDDGYQDNYMYAFVLARGLQAPITVFLIPGYIQSGDYFWWLEGQRLVRRTRLKEATFEGRTYHLQQQEERDELARAIDTRLRYARSVADREAFLETVRKLLAVPSSIMLEEEAMLPLTWRSEEHT